MKPGTAILHSRDDDVIPFTDSEELVRSSALPQSALIEIGTACRSESLEAMLWECEMQHVEQNTP
jgi:hypothetical protein